ncbi:MAG: hypothetical protein PHR30_16635 [Gallionellaceae bacterium]|nr:hypothetical protein [Gallionellaceae bacterium]
MALPPDVRSPAPTDILLDDIVLDAGTQARASIDDELVTEYAEQTTTGSEFPPAVVFFDGDHYYMADGFHRALAARRVGRNAIACEIRAGTKTDALWHALGANRQHGKRLTPTDKRHAILLALQTFYFEREMAEKSTREIASQVGCAKSYVDNLIAEHQVATTGHLPSRVTGKDGKNYPARRQAPPARPAETKTSKYPDRSPSAVQQRREQMQKLAATGHTSRQIAAAVGVGLDGCRVRLRQLGIDVPADQIVGRARQHDPNRIVEQMVIDAENLTADTGLIDFAGLDTARLTGWITTLEEAKQSLGAFIVRLKKERGRHVEAA